jgi:hypothetical protein
MAPTIHQRAHLILWNWRDGPGWCRDPGSPELRELYTAGARVLRVHLQDNGQIPRGLVDGWRAQGWKVWGMNRPSGDPLGGRVWGAEETANWCLSERNRLGLQGMDFNFEEEVRAADVESNGSWSRSFTRRWRSIQWSGLPSHLDTYFGSFAGGMENAYTPRPANFRMSVQTFWGQPPVIWADPPTRIVSWIKGAQPRIPPSVVKPIYLCVRKDNGEIIDPQMAIEDQRLSGLKGLVLYYIDGGDVDWMCDFIRKALAAGVCY